MKEKICCEPGDSPATTDPYLQLYWTEGVHKLVELLHSRDRELKSFQIIYDMAVEYLNKKTNDYWKVKKELEVLKARLAEKEGE